MKNILLRIESRLDELTKAFHQLKSENEILRKEILGFSSSQNSEAMGLMETRTLREIVEQTEFCVNKINSNILKNEIKKKKEKSKPRGKLQATVNQESESETSHGSAEEFPIVQIRSKTLADERDILRATFDKLMKEKKVKDGESLQGTSVQTISNSTPLLQDVKTSCTIKLSNFLDSAVTDLQFVLWQASRNNGPSRVVGNFSEAFSFSGSRSYCNFLWSFAISKVLRLTIRCANSYDGGIVFGIGFTPADVPTNDTLYNTLHEMPPAPDVWMMNDRSEIPLELFVTHGNLLVRGHMTNGPRSIVHIEIMELLDNSWPISVVKGKKRLTNGKSLELNQSTNQDGSISRSVGKSGRFSCNVEIVNCLSVPLRNKNKWYCNSNDKDSLPLEIQSFNRESFLGSSDTKFKAMFSYEILSTDLALVIALKVGSGRNSFAAAFSQIPAFSGKNKLEALMNPSQWKMHDYQKYSNARNTLEVIRVRNIRAEILMTEEKNSSLKIRIYAV